MTATFETVRNVKSGKIGWVVDRYNRTNDGKAIVQVDTTHGIRHWLAGSVEVA